MESIASRFDPRSHKTQLVFTALAASALTAAAITSYNSYSRQQKRNELNRQVLNSVAASSSSDRGGSGVGRRKRRGTSPPRPEEISLNGGVGYGNGDWGGNESSAAYDEDLIREQLARNYAFFGEKGMEKIRGASVAVIGCGGVGSWAAVMLARSYAKLLFLFPNNRREFLMTFWYLQWCCEDQTGRLRLCHLVLVESARCRRPRRCGDAESQMPRECFEEVLEVD